MPRGGQEQSVADGLAKIHAEIAGLKTLPDAQQNMQVINALEQGVLSALQRIQQQKAQHAAQMSQQLAGGGMSGPPPGAGGPPPPPGGMPGAPPGGGLGPPPLGGGGVQRGGMMGLAQGPPNMDELRRMLSSGPVG